MPQSVRRFLWALGASLAVHLALLSAPALTPPEKSAPSPVIEARLATPPPPTPAQPERPKPRKPKPRPQPAKPAPSAPPVLTAPETETPVEEHVPPLAEAEPAPDVEETPPVAGIPGEKVPPPLPPEAELRYTLFKGENGLRVGRVATTWKARGDGGYSISSVAEASGLFSLFVSGRHVQISEGEITGRGLRPAAYWMQRGQQANKTDSARFDWNTMSLTLGTGMKKRSVALPEGTQDLLSALYQFAFTLAGSGPPPDGVFRLPITNGRKLDSYGYGVVGEEGLETPLGKLKTLHLSKLHNPGEEGTEIWLAADYHYLPVRIRVTDKQGDSAEQLIDEIRLSPKE